MLSLSRSPFGLILVILVVIVLGTGTLGYVQWRRTSQPEYRLRAGEKAIEKHKWSEAEDIANRLEAAGYSDQAYYLRGKAIFTKWQLYPTPELIDVDKAMDYLRHVRDDSPVSVPAKLLHA